uniref:M3 family metallopeptidase n=1 Tax=Fulvivirga sp. TaxID=1931237 RepID=UPI00404A827E
MPSENPFLAAFDTKHGIPPFSKINEEHFLPAVIANINTAKQEIDAIVNQEEAPTFENTIAKLEIAGTLLSNTTSVLFNLNSAETNDKIQKIAMEVSPLLSEYSNDISQNEGLFKRVRAIYERRNSLDLNAEQLMLLEKSYKGFVRNGSNLQGKEKDRYREVTRELSELALKYGENLLAETNKYILHVTSEADLAGLTDDVIEMAEKTAKAKGKTGWAFTLQAPSYIPFMENADNRVLREQLYRAYMSKCVKGDELDNQDIVKRVVALRLEMANLLGYATYADYVLEERMAQNKTATLTFLNDLLEKSWPKSKLEHQEVIDFAASIGYPEDIQRWDWAYLSEKLKKQKFDFDEELLKPYFPLNNVVNGVFEVAGRLFGLSFKENSDLDTYHEDVTAYEVFDANGGFKAVFYTDYFPREGKRGGAWMTNYRDQSGMKGHTNRPIVSIVCNFPPPTNSKPSLLSIDDVRTLFHEFGHALHSILSNVTYSSLAGTNVFWDFVELPSQIMENWVLEKECLDLFAKHYQTGEKIPVEYIDRIIASSKFQAAYQTVRQISLGKLDMTWHSLDAASMPSDVVKFENDTLASTSLFPLIDGVCMSTQFGHIFAGGYAAGYYSYKWAEVLDADAFAAFKEGGIFNVEIGKSFMDNILSKGGSSHPMDLYIKFRGQKPDPEALLIRSGLVEA